MRVLFTAFAASTHLYQQITLAWAFQCAGHEVRIATQPDMAEAVNRAGLTVIPVGAPLHMENMKDDSTVEDSGLGAEERPENLREASAESLSGLFSVVTPFALRSVCDDQTVDDTVSFARWWRPDLVLWDPMTFSGPIAARACGAVSGRLLFFGLDILGAQRAAHLDRLAQRPPELRDDPLTDWLTAHLDRIGALFREDVVVGDFTIDPVPAWLHHPDIPVPSRRVPMRPVPYNGRSLLPEWLHALPERPRLCLTLGLGHREILGGDTATPVQDLLTAAGELDIEVVATLDAEQTARLGPLPGNVRLVDFVPLNALLPTCSGVVHHGGAGSMAASVLCGVPQMLFPCLIWDTRHKAERLEELGAGIHMPADRSPSVDELAGWLARLVADPAMASAARRLRTETLRMPPPDAVVSEIVQLIRGLDGDHSPHR
ncbi:activator-dependent family glycosyltransferase [Thermobifida alba]|jgi:glycosyltransferase (activator-dependent family)|uniref:Activator-dependent family glycosyltransferase n=1 Tax=Thermobifida alba TaxID=53522 RepID=A0ABY4KZH6_THEAE|nr:activator-dependent family glycosyltransferase [Thermobifida alba]UPT20839.1 activator-dependent family glycosyltransferase [Thermobifida alba]